MKENSWKGKDDLPERRPGQGYRSSFNLRFTNLLNNSIKWFGEQQNDSILIYLFQETLSKDTWQFHFPPYARDFRTLIFNINSNTNEWNTEKEWPLFVPHPASMSSLNLNWNTFYVNFIGLFLFPSPWFPNIIAIPIIIPNMIGMFSLVSSCGCYTADAAAAATLSI